MEAAQYISLGFTILHVTSDKSSMSPCQSLTKLAQLNQARAWIILKIALCEPAKVGKLTVQTVEELEITMTLIHRTISARTSPKMQRNIAYNNAPAALQSNIPASRT